MITLTTSAGEAIRQSIEEGNMKGLALRLAAKESSNGGLEYGMGFDETADDDIVINSEGVDIVFSPQYGPLLKDTVIDFDKLDNGEQGFLFLNPNDPNYQPPGPASGTIGGDSSGGGCGSGGCGCG